jgi:DnaJ-class molecular chaperone
MKTCETCRGTGSIVISSPCDKCRGTGEIIDYDDDGNEVMYTCFSCEYGFIFNEQVCDLCAGKGTIKKF